MANAADLSRTLFIADNLPVLRGIDSESIDLIATDPPFNKGVKAFEGIVAAGVGKAGRKVSYKDTWTWGDVQDEWVEAIKNDHPNLYAVIQAANVAAGEDMGAFLCWLGVRVLEMHRILKPTGSLYLHIDHTAHAYAKTMLDAVFGRQNFRNAINWVYGQGARGAKAVARQFARNNDIILFYSKSARYSFNRVDVFDRHPLDRLPSHIKVDGTGAFKTSPRGDYTDTSIARLEGEGRIYRTASGAIRIKYPLPIEKGYVLEARAVGSSWSDIPDMMHVSMNERTGYPTQKPLALYERIIKASSNEGDLVLDPFAGCATTCVAAERLGREWIGIDINAEAERVTKDRLQKEARLPLGTRSWNRAVKTRTTPPRRTDDGAKAAPELVLIGSTPKGPRMTVRELRERLSKEDGTFCQGCGYSPPNGLVEYMEVDHRQPKSRQGRDDIRNRVLLCAPCNGTKGNKLTLAELRLKRIQEGRMLNKAWTMAWYEREGKFG